MKRNFLTFIMIMLVVPVFAQDNDMKPGNIDVDIRYLENGDFENFDTYKFITDESNLNQDSWVSMNAIPTAMIEDALEHEMDASGMNRAMSEDPDIIINYHLFSKDWQPSAMMATDNAVFLYMNKDENEGEDQMLDEGTLVLNVVDAKTGEVVWEGYARGLVDENSNLRDQRMQIRMGIAQLAERFMAFRNLGPEVAGENGRPFRNDNY